MELNPSCSTTSQHSFGAQYNCASTIRPLQQQVQIIKSRHHGMTFQQLIDELLAVISSNDEKSVRSAAGGIEHRFGQISSIFKQLKHFLGEPQSKRKDSFQILQNAYDILSQLILLKNHLPKEQLTPHIDRTLKALKLTTSLSHDSHVGPVKALENRKLQVSLCFVELLTELLIHDVETFGLGIDAYEKCGRMRREIANALMNLVYQHREAKQRLCANLAFLRRVSDIVEQVPSLDQYYAGLIQNVSYNTDKKAVSPFAHHLAVTVPPLVKVVTSSMPDGRHLSSCDQQLKQRLYKILSALWNLAEHPIENKRVMCVDFPAFVPLLLRIMFGDPREVSLIQAATGILKHLCDFIIQYPELCSKTIGCGAVLALLQQIYSSSPDLIVDALIALSILCKHPYAVQELLSQQNFLHHILFLNKNTNESIVRAARGLLNTVNSFYYQAPNEMSNSLVDWNFTSYTHQSNQYLGAVPGQFHTLPRMFQQNKSENQRFLKSKEQSTKFKEFPYETPKGALKQQQQQLMQCQPFAEQEYSQYCQHPAASSSVNQQIVAGSRQEKLMQGSAFSNAEEEEDVFDGFITEPCIEAGQHLTTSVQCTRGGSPQTSPTGSSNDVTKNGDEWPSSVRSTSVNSHQTSGAASPASPSDLPDSPSQCASHKPFQDAVAMVLKKALEEEEEATSDELDKPAVSVSSKETIITEQALEPKEKRVMKENAESVIDEAPNEDKYSVNDNFLDETIRKYMPKPQQHFITPNSMPYPHSQTFALHTTPIQTPISTHSPSQSPVRSAEKKEAKLKNHDQLLTESIASVMPNPTKGKRQDTLTKQMSTDLIKNSQIATKNEAKNKSFSNCVTTDLPVDVDAEIKAQWLFVDCGKVAQNEHENNADPRRFTLKKTHSQSSIPRPSVSGLSTPNKRIINPSDEAVKPLTGNKSSQKLQSLPRPLRSKQPPPLAPKPNIANLTKSHRQKMKKNPGRGEGESTPDVTSL